MVEAELREELKRALADGAEALRRCMLHDHSQCGWAQPAFERLVDASVGRLTMVAEPSLVSPPPPLPPQLLALSKAATPGEWAQHKSFPDKIVPAAHGDRTVGASIFEDANRDHYAHVLALVNGDNYGHASKFDNIRFLVAAANFIRSCESAGAESTPGEGGE